MRLVHAGQVTAFVCALALLGTLSTTVGLSGYGWLVGVACAVGTHLGLARGLARRCQHTLGLANWVTLSRSVLVGGVAALAAESFSQSVPVAILVTLSASALALDAVDGWVARRTRTQSTLGARFDLEIDALLILVLSVYVAQTTGWWVLAIGAARYLFLAAGRVLPWLRESLPERYWCKVVAAVQGIVLTVVAGNVLPQRLSIAALAVCLILLAESFGRQVWGLWRLAIGSSDAPTGRWDADATADEQRTAAVRRRQRLRTARSRLVTALAGLAVWAALVAPDDIDRLSPWTFARIPLEGLVVVVLALVLHPWARAMAAAVFGVLLGVLVILKILDIGFLAVLDRPFDPLNDWVYFGPGVGVLGDSIGNRAAVASAVTSAVIGVAILTLLPLCVVRLTRLVASHRRVCVRAVTGLGTVWVLCAVFGLQLSPGAPLASTSAADQALDEVSQVRADIRSRQVFAKEIGLDRFDDTPDGQLLTGLRGKDVILAFVESYGRVAVQDSTFSPQVDAVLDAGTTRLRAAGFSSRSAFLTSPTFGAASWLAHSTLQSGLWVDSQQRYEQLLANDRLTLTRVFGRAGWRTVFDVPANTEDWPEGSSFYQFDQLYDSRNVGYRGPKFSYASMPDQYILSAYRRLELATTDRAPVMGEIDLVSSHHPWTPLPHLVDWDDVGDGSIFDGMPEQGESPDDAFRDPARVRALYGQSVEYSLSSLISFVQAYPDPDLVLIVLGDHQPHSYVTGGHPGHDVPITIIAHDPAVMDAISGWRWQSGMNPGRDAPVWRMDTFRDRFLSAYGTQREPATSVRADPPH